MGIFKQKCEFCRKCPWYDKNSPTCNEDGGYWGSSYPGCYRTMSEAKQKQKTPTILIFLIVTALILVSLTMGAILW